MKPNRSHLIRLAYSRPELRPALLPVIEKLGGTSVEGSIDLDIAPDIGMVLLVLDDGEPFDGDADEVLHQVETDDELGEGHLIVYAVSSPLRRGDRVEIVSSRARPRGGSFVGDVKVRKV